MTSYRDSQHAVGVTALADEDLESVIGGCFGIPVTVNGGLVYVSPTTGFPNLSVSTLPTFPANPRGPFPF